MSYDAYGHQRARNRHSQSAREPRPARRYDYDDSYGRRDYNYERRDRSYFDDYVYDRRWHVARDCRDGDWGARRDDGRAGPFHDLGELRRHSEDRHDDNARRQERDEQQYEIDLYERDPEKYQEYFYAHRDREEAGAGPDAATHSNDEGNASQHLQLAATLPGPCTPSAISQGKTKIGTLGPHTNQDNRGTQQEDSDQAYKNLHQRPGLINGPQQIIDDNQLQETEVKRAPLAIPMQPKKDNHVTKDVVRPSPPAVELHQKQDVGQVSRSLPQSIAPMSLPQSKTTTQGHNATVQRAPPAIASNLNNVKPPNGIAVQLARLRAELAQKTQEIYKIRQEYVKLQQTQRMQAMHAEKEAAVRANPAIVTGSKNDSDQTDTITVRVKFGKLKDEWEIERNKKAAIRELELAIARARVPVPIEKEAVHDNQLSAPMATAEATQRRLSMTKNDPPVPPQTQEQEKRILDWLEFTDKHSRRRKRSGDYAHISSPNKRIKKSCPLQNQGGMPSSSSSSSTQTSERSLLLVVKASRGCGRKASEPERPMKMIRE